MKLRLLGRRIIRDIKIFFTHIAYRFIFFSKWWYTLTMKLTKITSKKVRYYDSCNEIADDYGWGSRYKQDPLNGKLDYLTHPSRLAYNAANELPFGDCDDHAIFWCTALLKSGIAKRAWFSFYSMEKITGGEMSAHAICVFEHADNEMYYWADYQLPSCLDEFKDKWLAKAAEKFKSTPIVGAMIEVVRIKEDDTPVFGKITIIRP